MRPLVCVASSHPVLGLPGAPVGRVGTMGHGQQTHYAPPGYFTPPCPCPPCHCGLSRGTWSPHCLTQLSSCNGELGLEVSGAVHSKAQLFQDVNV